MSNRALLILVIAVAAVVAGAVWMHRPRAGTDTRSLSLHGSR
jgi:hypothetical protein